MAARTLRKKKQQQSRVFFDVMFTLTWVTEKELERVIENKRDEFCRKKNMKIQSGGEDRVSEMLAASKVKMSGSEK